MKKTDLDALSVEPVAMQRPSEKPIVDSAETQSKTRDDLLAEMQVIVELVTLESRTMTSRERDAFDRARSQVEELDQPSRLRRDGGYRNVRN